MAGRLRVAIVGCGIGRDHLAGFRALPGQWTVAAVCDVDRGRAAALAGEGGVARMETDLGRLIGDPAIDVIDLCTPPYQHFEQIVAVLRAGQHVICEKPLVGSLAEVDALAGIAAGARGRLLPILQKRFGNGLRQLEHLKGLGLTGRALVTTVENHWRREADYYAVPWRGRWATELGGVNLTQAIHAHDIVMHVLGPVGRVFAATRTA
ncbi:MAG: Gfo/Idh/MocA family oxidoreductase, partial [Azospirillaceae bacterium]